VWFTVEVLSDTEATCFLEYTALLDSTVVEVKALGVIEVMETKLTVVEKPLIQSWSQPSLSTLILQGQNLG
jgi:hypothetical protein